jgi:hypothetical protein
MTDWEVAKRIHKHGPDCWFERCVCDYPERVHNTFLVLRTVRLSERKACEDIARECGGARAADRIRDRVLNDDKR